MVLKRKEKTQSNTLFNYIGSKSSNSAGSKNHSSSTTSTTNHHVKRKSIDLTSSHHDDDPIEIDEDDEDDLTMVESSIPSSSLTSSNKTFQFKQPTSAFFFIERKLKDPPKTYQLHSLAFTPKDKACVYPYHHHYSHDQCYQHAIRTKQPPLTSHLFYRRLTGIPLSDHVKQTYQRRESLQWFKKKPNELARLVDMADTRSTEYVTCMDVSGNAMAYGTHKGKLTMCDFMEREKYFTHNFDDNISNTVINPFIVGELAVSTLSTSTSGSLYLFDMCTGKIKSTILNDSILDFKYMDGNTMIISKKNGKLDIQDLRTKKRKIVEKVTTKSTYSSITSSPISKPTPSVPSSGIGVLVSKKSTKKKVTIPSSSLPKFSSDPFNCIALDKNDPNFLYASSYHTMDLKIFDLRRSVNDSLMNVNISSCIQGLKERLKGSIFTVNLQPKTNVNNSIPNSSYVTENGLVINEVTQIQRHRTPTYSLPISTETRGIKSFDTTKSGFVHFLTTRGGIGLLDIRNKTVSKYFENTNSFKLDSFGQKGDVIENDGGMFLLAPYGSSVEILDWSRPHIDEWLTIDKDEIRKNSHDINRTMHVSKEMFKGVCKNNISQVRVMNANTPDQKIVCSEFDSRLVYFDL